MSAAGKAASCSRIGPAWEWHHGQGFKKVLVPWTMCPRITPEFIAAEEASCGKAWVDQEYRCLFTAMDITPGALIAPGYYATMGYGVPAGLGAQAATGQRPLVLVGDGAFQMTGWELGNSRRYGWDPVVIVFNNASWEMLRAFQPQSRFNDLGTWDFASMAAGLGGDGQHVTTRAELQAALTKAFSTRGRFQLIDVRLAPGSQSPTLERFVGAVKRLSMPG